MGDTFDVSWSQDGGMLCACFSSGTLLVVETDISKINSRGRNISPAMITQGVEEKIETQPSNSGMTRVSPTEMKTHTEEEASEDIKKEDNKDTSAMEISSTNDIPSMDLTTAIKEEDNQLPNGNDHSQISSKEESTEEIPKQETSPVVDSGNDDTAMMIDAPSNERSQTESVTSTVNDISTGTSEEITKSVSEI